MICGVQHFITKFKTKIAQAVPFIFKYWLSIFHSDYTLYIEAAPWNDINFHF